MQKPISFWLGVLAILFSCASTVLYFTSYREFQRPALDFSILSDDRRFYLAFIAQYVWLFTPLAIVTAFVVRLIERPKR
jgi:hypothetical protein